jgi:hypothetical protein
MSDYDSFFDKIFVEKMGMIKYTGKMPTHLIYDLESGTGIQSYVGGNTELVKLSEEDIAAYKKLEADKEIAEQA